MVDDVVDDLENLSQKKQKGTNDVKYLLLTNMFVVTHSDRHIFIIAQAAY